MLLPFLFLVPYFQVVLVFVHPRLCEMQSVLLVSLLGLQDPGSWIQLQRVK